MAAIGQIARVVPQAVADGGLRRERTITVLAALSWVGGMIHAMAAPAHWDEYVPFAIAFVVLAAAQGAWAVAFFRAPSAVLLRGSAIVSLGVAAVWALSRTTGLPLGPDAGVPEAAGLADVGATYAELLLGAAGLALWRDGVDGEIPWWVPVLGTLALVLAGVALLLGSGGHAHAH